jgi:DNA-directed RNA polymerase subunit RPC12/RpoP
MGLMDEFENPGSALRKATRSNPRKYPCPTCKKSNKLTAEDVRHHYQCDECADRAEGIF